MERVRVARIGKPHGIRGEVTVELFTDEPEERFSSGTLLTVERSNGASSNFDQLTVLRARWHNGILLVTFEEFSDRNTAESLRNSQLFAAADETHEDDDSWYAHELIDFDVRYGTETGDHIGIVTDLRTGDHQDLLVVLLTSGRKAMLPFVTEIVPEIIRDKGIVVVTPPPGLLEL